jgi:D-proline reductase (dithiol) PrdB
LERRGLPTLTFAVLWEFVQAFKPPRAIESDFPLGATLGRPNDPEMQRAVLRAGLAAAPAFAPPWRAVLQPLPWHATGDRSWEEDTRNLYRNDDDDTLQAHQSDHNDRGDVLAGNEAAFLAQHAI